MKNQNSKKQTAKEQPVKKQPMKKQPKKEILVIGYHNEDLNTEIDLTRFERQQVIKFEKGELLLKRGAKLKMYFGDNCYCFDLKLKNANKKKGPKYDEKTGYYKIAKGDKYELDSPPKRAIPGKESACINKKGVLECGDENTIETLTLPCKSKSWGGGGMNLALTLRALSPARITNVRYLDLKFGKSAADDLYEKLVVVHNSQPGVVSRFGKNRKKELLDIISPFGPDECIEMFLNKKHIDFDFIPTKSETLRANLVISKITDGINTIGDRIIFKSPVPKDALKEKKAPADVVKLIRKAYKNCNTIVLNTVKHYVLFKAVFIAYMEMPEKRRPKLIVIFTDDNRKWFRDLKLEVLPNGKKIIDDNNWKMDCIFNEKEFQAFMENVDEKKSLKTPTRKDINYLFSDGSPDFDKLTKLFTNFRINYNATTPHRIYVTLGPHGSAGVDETNRIMHIKTFPTRGVLIYDTNGCGDAWAATIVLLEHHKKSMEPPIRRQMSRFMRIASGVAWTKMTSPYGTVKIEEVVTLLQNNYIPWTITGEAIESEGEVKKGKVDSDKINSDGSCKRIMYASSIDYNGYNDIICGW